MKTTNQKYIEVCAQLGFRPETDFVTVHPNGSIGFSIGKPEELRALASACTRAGFRITKKFQKCLDNL